LQAKFKLQTILENQKKLQANDNYNLIEEHDFFEELQVDGD